MAKPVSKPKFVKGDELCNPLSNGLYTSKGEIGSSMSGTVSPLKSMSFAGRKARKNAWMTLPAAPYTRAEAKDSGRHTVVAGEEKAPVSSKPRMKGRVPDKRYQK